MNGWSRVPDTARCRIRVANYLQSLGCGGFSYATVYRLARQMEVFGIDRRDVYHELRRLGQSHLTNVVQADLARRERAASMTRPVFELLADGSLRPTGQLRQVGR